VAGKTDFFKLRAEIPPLVYLAFSAGAFVLLGTGWAFFTYSGLVSPLFLPSPGDVLRSAVYLFKEAHFLYDIAVSTFRIMVGFFLAALVGVPLGILMGSLRIAEAFFEPVVGFIRYMPASAFIPLLILWVGIGDLQKILLIFIGTFFQLVLMVMDVAKNVPQELLDVSYTLGAKRWEVFRWVFLPASLPGILDTLRICCGWAWTYVIVAELVAAMSGVGYRIMTAQRLLQTPEIIVGILTIGVLGLVIDLLFKVLYRRLFAHWL